MWGDSKDREVDAEPEQQGRAEANCLEIDNLGIQGCMTRASCNPTLRCLYWNNYLEHPMTSASTVRQIATVPFYLNANWRNRSCKQRRYKSLGHRQSGISESLCRLIILLCAFVIYTEEGLSQHIIPFLPI